MLDQRVVNLEQHLEFLERDLDDVLGRDVVEQDRQALGARSPLTLTGLLGRVGLAREELDTGRDEPKARVVVVLDDRLRQKKQGSRSKSGPVEISRSKRLRQDENAP